MGLNRFSLLTSFLLLFPLFHILEADMFDLENSTGLVLPSSPTLSSSPWLRMTVSGKHGPREPGCWNRPWICKEGDRPPWTKRICCKNRCVDVMSDINNCGFCNIRCPFSWKCCGGFCINTNINPFHCGRCRHKCPFRSLCIYGMCGYAATTLPLPLPFPPFPFPPEEKLSSLHRSNGGEDHVAHSTLR